MSLTGRIRAPLVWMAAAVLTAGCGQGGLRPQGGKTHDITFAMPPKYQLMTPARSVTINLQAKSSIAILLDLRHAAVPGGCLGMVIYRHPDSAKKLAALVENTDHLINKTAEDAKSKKSVESDHLTEYSWGGRAPGRSWFAHSGGGILIANVSGDPKLRPKEFKSFSNVMGTIVTEFLANSGSSHPTSKKTISVNLSKGFYRLETPKEVHIPQDGKNRLAIIYPPLKGFTETTPGLQINSTYSKVNLSAASFLKTSLDKISKESVFGKRFIPDPSFVSVHQSGEVATANIKNHLLRVHGYCVRMGEHYVTCLLYTQSTGLPYAEKLDKLAKEVVNKALRSASN